MSLEEAIPYSHRFAVFQMSILAKWRRYTSVICYYTALIILSCFLCLFFFVALNISVVLLDFPPETSVIRGYNQTLAFNFTVKNLSPLIDIVQVDGTDQNFNATVVFARGEDLATISEETTNYVNSDISMEQLQQGLPANATVTFSGTGNVLLSRQMCSQYHYACLMVHPGPGSTFQLPEESFRHQSCLPTSTIVNCEGAVLNLFSFQWVSLFLST